MRQEITEALSYALNKGIQIHPNALAALEDADATKLMRVMREVIVEKTRQHSSLITKDDIEAALGIKESTDITATFDVLFDPSPNIASAEGIEGYGALFKSRYEKLHKIISQRPEAKKLKPVTGLKGIKKPNTEMYVCGLVLEKNIGKDRATFKLDDFAGISDDISVYDEKIIEKVSLLLDDQMIMVEVIESKKGNLVAKDVIVPGVISSPENRSKTDTYAAFVSDLHIGSKFFMESEFTEFVDWLSSPDPKARKVRFLIIGGDLLDGVGIYKDQNKELVCQTIEEQLEKAYEILCHVPKHIQIFISPGNHDPGRRALPQPAIPKKYHAKIWERPNITMVGNPSMIALNSVKVLIYHGQSIDDLVRTTPGMEYENPTKVMVHLLKARHLGPIYGGSTPVAPEAEDMLVIDDVPDIFQTGHVHISGLETYKGILLLNSGAWQKQTGFQASVGITPTPGIAILVNLKTLKPDYYMQN